MENLSVKEELGSCSVEQATQELFKEEDKSEYVDIVKEENETSFMEADYNIDIVKHEIDQVSRIIMQKLIFITDIFHKYILFQYFCNVFD